MAVAFAMLVAVATVDAVRLNAARRATERAPLEPTATA
jgi:hypothetical protein